MIPRELARALAQAGLEPRWNQEGQAELEQETPTGARQRLVVELLPGLLRVGALWGCCRPRWTPSCSRTAWP